MTPPVPDATPTSNGPLCVGDTLRLFSSLEPGVTYNWQGPPMFSSSLPLPVMETSLPWIRRKLLRP